MSFLFCYQTIRKIVQWINILSSALLMNKSTRINYIINKEKIDDK